MVTEIPASVLVRETERWSTSVLWPAPVDERQRGLVELAIDDGAEHENLTRAELLSALVFSAPSSGEELSQLLRRYRKARVGETVVQRQGATSTKVVVLSQRRPGPRS